MRLTQVRVYTGPSIYAHRPIIRVRLDGGNTQMISREEFHRRLDETLAPFTTISQISEKVKSLVPNGNEIHWADAYGALAVVLQDDRFPEPLCYRVMERAESECQILVETNDPDLGEAAVRFAKGLLQFLYIGDLQQRYADAYDRLGQGVEKFIKHRSEVRTNESVRLLVAAAKSRDIPLVRLVPNSETLVFGQGYRQQRLTRCLSDLSSAISVRIIAYDKSVTSRLLRDSGLPVPRQFVVRTENELAEAVKQIGFPLVVKGSVGAQGYSVTTRILSEEELRRAIKKVQQFKRDVLIEQQIEGDDYRLTVVGGRLVAAARRVSARVIGDGQHSIRELIDIENSRRRSLGAIADWLVPLTINDDANVMLKRQGYTEDSVPCADDIVFLRRMPNLTQGGLSEDVTDIVHPEIASTIERAVRIVGSDMAGVDFITTDITRPLSETNGAILEVNSWPGLRPHYSTLTPPRDVAGAIIGNLFPGDDRGCIPTIAVTGTNGKTTTCRMIRRIFETAGKVVGSSTSTDVVIGGRTVAQGDCSGGRYATMIIKDPTVEVGVFEMARGALIQFGTRLDRYSVGVVTNVTNDHLELENIDSLEAMARVKRLVAEVARDAVVLNADNDLCVAMASHVSAPVWWITRNTENSVVQDHLNKGGHAVIVAERRGQEVLLNCERDTEVEILPTADIPAAMGGLAQVNIENAAAAAAAALATGLEIEAVARALRLFSTSVDDSPGRFNIFETNGIKIILDFAHNVEGLEKLIELIDQLPHPGKRLCFFSLTNSRHRHHYDLVTRVLAGQFDHYVVSDQTPAAKRRSRTEIMDWLMNGLIKAGVNADSVEGTPEVWEGIEMTLRRAEPGDIVFVKSGADAQAYWDYISNFDYSRYTLV